MSYQVLARKWRPQNFQQMIGQEHVTQALMNALQQQRLHHAYLFTGTRGVGKTSVARIFAKSLNCETGITAEPCGKCNACVQIEQGRFVDLIEVDAASRTRVEDTKELLDNVQYAPVSGRFKIYLIDEVHMLSGHSFNALLKTLEEPPESVKFLLATTDPQRLPITVLSRCLQFHMKNMAPEQISAHLQTVLNEEKIAYEDAALMRLSLAADGSMRDALSLLDQAIAYSGDKIQRTQVDTMLGCVAQQDISGLLQALFENNASNVIARIHDLSQQNPDFDKALETVLTYLQRIALTQISEDSLDETLDEKDFILQSARNVSKEDIQLFYQCGLIGRRDLPLAPTPRMGFEMIFLRMLAFQPASIEVPQKSKTTIKQSAPQASTIETQAQPIKPKQEQPEPKKEEKPVPQVEQKQTEKPAPKVNVVDGELDWTELSSQLSLTGATKMLAQNCSLQSFDNNKLNLRLASEHGALLTPQKKQRLNDALNDALNQTITLEIDFGEHQVETPSSQAQRKIQEKKDAALDKLHDDENVQDLLNTFDANVQKDSIVIKDK